MRGIVLEHAIALRIAADLPEHLYNQIIAGAGGWLADGWRYATGAELCSMVRSEGFTFYDQFDRCPGISGFPNAGIGYKPNGTTWPEAELFGENRPGHHEGMFDDQVSGGSGNPIGLGAFFPGSFPNVPGSVFVHQDFAGDSNPDYGSFLVRPVPEPNPAALLALGLVALGLRRRW